jgi:hypothetical protein
MAKAIPTTVTATPISPVLGEAGAKRAASHPRLNWSSNIKKYAASMKTSWIKRSPRGSRRLMDLSFSAERHQYARKTSHAKLAKCNQW